MRKDGKNWSRKVLFCFFTLSIIQCFFLENHCRELPRKQSRVRILTLTGQQNLLSTFTPCNRTTRRPSANCVTPQGNMKQHGYFTRWNIDFYYPNDFSNGLLRVHTQTDSQLNVTHGEAVAKCLCSGYRHKHRETSSSAQLLNATTVPPPPSKSHT